MDATGILDRPADAPVEQRAIALASHTTLRMDWILTALSVWLVGGFYVDIWAHAHGQVDDTFFTPWHGLLYSGAASFGVVLGAAAILGRPRSVPLRDTLAPPYRLAFLGSLLFAVAGVIDLAWHTLFGFEVDVESLLSPSHLLLATSGMLMVGGPIRAAAARLRDGAPRSWRTVGPLAIPLAMAIAILVAFTQYANPIADPWAEALPADDPTITAQLYAMNADGTGQRRLTYLPGSALNARWSPDGSRLVYSYQPPGQATDPEVRTQLHVMNADGSGDRVLAIDTHAADPAWSPDGARIAFAGSADDGQYDIFVVNSDGTALEQLTSDAATDFAVTWTPDGSALLFNSDRNGDFDIVRLDLSTKAVTAVTTGPANDYEPAISPDGTRIAFTSDRRGQNSYDVWLAGIDGSGPVRFTVGTNDEVGDSYMPPGRRTGRGSPSRPTGRATSRSTRCRSRVAKRRTSARTPRRATAGHARTGRRMDRRSSTPLRGTSRSGVSTTSARGSARRACSSPPACWPGSSCGFVADSGRCRSAHMRSSSAHRLRWRPSSTTSTG
jgi:hypothetical protein